MKKFLYISLFLFLSLSCDKQVIVPSSSTDSDLVDNNSDISDNSRHFNEELNSNQKDFDSDVIIDPNGRDDVGDKKSKKSK